MAEIKITQITVIKDPFGNYDWSGADRRCVSLNYKFVNNNGEIIQLNKCKKCVEYERDNPQEGKQWACLFCTPKK